MTVSGRRAGCHAHGRARFHSLHSNCANDAFPRNGFGEPSTLIAIEAALVVQSDQDLVDGALGEAGEAELLDG
jgi:hypothetical protein